MLPPVRRVAGKLWIFDEREREAVTRWEFRSEIGILEVQGHAPSLIINFCTPVEESQAGILNFRIAQPSSLISNLIPISFLYKFILFAY